MIIVSQDKDKIINFDNLTQIYITQDEEITAYFIRFETVDSLYDDLGEYKTEERAREVLQEIIIAIRGKNMVQFSNGEMKEVYPIKNDVYEMPLT